MRALLIASALCLPAIAHADDTFEAKAAAAKPLAHVEDLVWALTAKCDAGDDTQQRQCKKTRDARMTALIAQPLLVEADADALDVGEWNAAKKSVSVTLLPCVRCKGVTVEGKTWQVTGKGAALYDTARQFQTAETANAWIKAIAHHKVELIVRVVGAAGVVTGGKPGLQVDVEGYRVITPCNGTVVLANPPSGNAPPDKAACAAGGASVVALTPELISEAMTAPMSVIKICAKKERSKGKGKLELTIADDGTLAAYEQTGDFVGTPTGKCIDEAMKTVTFPRSAKPRTKIGYPIVLP